MQLLLCLAAHYKFATGSLSGPSACPPRLGTIIGRLWPSQTKLLEFDCQPQLSRRLSLKPHRYADATQLLLLSFLQDLRIKKSAE